MPPEYPADDNESFDPFRHRKEIELMEQRFRERTERSDHAAPPPTTGAIDEQVQDEMRQFFTESTSLLEEVVPTLQARHAQDSSETTGEIRRKIDAFFGDSGGGMIRAERTMEIAAESTLPPPVQGFRGAHTAPSAAEPPPIAPAFGAPAAQYGGVSAPEPRRYDSGGLDDTVSPLESGTIRRAEHLEPTLPEPRGNVRASLPRPARRVPRNGSQRPAMDLKSALERLRKHGVVRDPHPSDSQPAPPPARPAPPPAPHRVQAPPPPPTTHNGAPMPEPLAPRPASVRPDTPAMARPPAARAPAPPPLGGPRTDGFDDIFAEVEGLVRGTLADSVQETFAEARHQETALRAKLSTSSPSPDTVDRPPALSSMLSRPSEDEIDEDEAPAEEAPAGPYDWGVKQAERPRGAWLLDEGAEDAVRERMGGVAASPDEAPESDLLEDTGEIEVTVARPAPKPEAPAPAAAEDRLGGDAPPAPSGGGGGPGGAAGGILARKLEAESSRFAPMLDKLMAAGVVSESEIDDEDDGGDDDDEISVAEFQDNRPRGDDQSMTPMRIVEEIRRLRRIQELLVSKGLVSEGEITSPSPADD